MKGPDGNSPSGMESGRGPLPRSLGCARTLLAASVLIMIGSSGCTAGLAARVNADLFELDVNGPSEVKIFNIKVLQDGVETVVKGSLSRRLALSHGPFQGHVDIEISAPTGEVYTEFDVPITPRRIPRKRSGTSEFTASLPIQLEKGCVVRVDYHTGDH